MKFSRCSLLFSVARNGILGSGGGSVRLGQPHGACLLVGCFLHDLSLDAVDVIGHALTKVSCFEQFLP